MQPSPQGPLDFSRVDATLAQVRAYYTARPYAPLGVKLRILASDQVPLWAERIAGGPVALFRNPQGCFRKPCPISVGKVRRAECVAA